MVSINTLSSVLSFRSTTSSSSSSLHLSLLYTSHCAKNTTTAWKRKRMLSTCTTATSILFLLAVVDLVASVGIEPSSSMSLLTAPTHSIPSEQHGQRINNHIIPLAGLGSHSTIVELAPEELLTSPNMRTVFEKRQVVPWPTASHPPPGDPSIPDTTTLLASSSSNPPSPPSSSTAATPTSSPHPVIPIPDLPRPDVKPYLLTDFEYDTMWNPNYNTLRLGVLLPFSSKPSERQSLMVRKTMSVRMRTDAFCYHWLCEQKGFVCRVDVGGNSLQSNFQPL